MARKLGLQAWIGRWRGVRSSRPGAAGSGRCEEHRAAVDVETCARALARRHREQAGRQVSAASRRSGVHPRKALFEHERSLRRAYAVARVGAAEQRRMEPAAEWLLDNFYVVRTQMRELAPALSTRALRKLPQVVDPQGAVIPRALA
ncbi:MAG TPA: hypothetical protein VJ722_09095, partial [Rhodanobacteraceae bacterium]|nr:hypothetical protein [Rhodanobacteraceae bacterium]